LNAVVVKGCKSKKKCVLVKVVPTQETICNKCRKRVVNIVAAQHCCKHVPDPLSHVPVGHKMAAIFSAVPEFGKGVYTNEFCCKRCGASLAYQLPQYYCDKCFHNPDVSNNMSIKRLPKSGLMLVPKYAIRLLCMVKSSWLNELERKELSTKVLERIAKKVAEAKQSDPVSNPNVCPRCGSTKIRYLGEPSCFVDGFLPLTKCTNCFSLFKR